MNANRIVRTSASALFLFLGTGCTGLALASGAAAGAAAAVYVRGDLEADLEATPTEVAAASEQALADLDIPLVSKEVTGLDGRLEAETAREKRIQIQLESLADGRTKTAIRVGTFGDEDLSREILAGIRRHLRA